MFLAITNKGFNLLFFPPSAVIDFCNKLKALPLDLYYTADLHVAELGQIYKNSCIKSTDFVKLEMPEKKELIPKMLYKGHLQDLIPEQSYYRLLDKAIDFRFLYKLQNHIMEKKVRSVLIQ